HGDTELVAPKAAARVGRANRVLELVGEHANRLVADVVALRVVDLLEVVKIEHQQGEASLVALGGGDCPIDRAFELGPVGKSGEVVGAGLPGVLAGAGESHGDLIRDSG